MSYTKILSNVTKKDPNGNNHTNICRVDHYGDYVKIITTYYFNGLRSEPNIKIFRKPCQEFFDYDNLLSKMDESEFINENEMSI